jgi:hypothetical protein
MKFFLNNKYNIYINIKTKKVQEKVKTNQRGIKITLHQNQNL